MQERMVKEVWDGVQSPNSIELAVQLATVQEKIEHQSANTSAMYMSALCQNIWQIQVLSLGWLKSQGVVTLSCLWLHDFHRFYVSRSKVVSNILQIFWFWHCVALLLICFDEYDLDRIFSDFTRSKRLSPQQYCANILGLAVFGSVSPLKMWSHDFNRFFGFFSDFSGSFQGHQNSILQISWVWLCLALWFLHIWDAMTWAHLFCHHHMSQMCHNSQTIHISLSNLI